MKLLALFALFAVAKTQTTNQLSADEIACNAALAANTKAMADVTTHTATCMNSATKDDDGKSYIDCDQASVTVIQKPTCIANGKNLCIADRGRDFCEFLGSKASAKCCVLDAYKSACEGCMHGNAAANPTNGDAPASGTTAGGEDGEESDKSAEEQQCEKALTEDAKLKESVDKFINECVKDMTYMKQCEGKEDAAEETECKEAQGMKCVVDKVPDYCTFLKKQASCCKVEEMEVACTQCGIETGSSTSGAETAFISASVMLAGAAAMAM